MSQQQVPDEIIRCNFEMIGEHDLCFSLSRFVCEVKKLDGSDYPPPECYLRVGCYVSNALESE